MAKNKPQKQEDDLSKYYPPVVAVLGHVDSGKTTLLDTVRKTDVAAREHGGITQKIGASSIEIEHEGKARKITFIDTPGHEAFIKMRARGFQAADIVLLVVSSSDGIMPQTRESIELLKSSKTPFIAVLTMADLATKNVEKVKGQLKKAQVLLEEQGGEVPVIEVSAKENKNIKELLDLILLVWDLKEHKELPTFKGIIIESKLDPKKGPLATLVIKGGTLKLRDEISSDGTKARVKSIINNQSQSLSSAGIGEAVEVLGFEKVPKVGALVSSGRPTTLQDDARRASIQDQSITPSSLSESRHTDQSLKISDTGPTFSSLASGQPPIPAIPDLLKVILVADSQGSLEAIEDKLSSKISILLAKTGEIEASDILFAKSVGAIILGFNIKIRPQIAKLAENEKVLTRSYSLIYEMLSEVEDFLEGKAEALEEKILGKAKVLASFPYERKKVLGVAVLEGRVAKGDRVRLTRDDQIIGESMISSLKIGKEPASKVEQGQEAGILLTSELDFNLGDVLISHA